MLGLMRRAVASHWDAHTSTPANLAAAVGGIAINNILFMYGMWLMLFAGKAQNQTLLAYSLALYAVTSMAWGIVGYLLGGLRELGRHIEEGTLDAMLATPRHPLVLVALSSSQPQGLGDVLQGLMAVGLVGWTADWGFALRALLVLAGVCCGFVGLFVLAGSLVFFFARGASLGDFLVEVVLSLSAYPTGKMFGGQARWIVYLTPALFTSILPMAAVEAAGVASFATAAAGSALFLAATVGVFQLGLRRYQSGSFVGRMR